jgi:hypothetical protein
MMGGRGPARDRRLLGEMLIEAGLLTRDVLAAGLEEQRLMGGRLGFTLLRSGRVGASAFHLFLQDNMAGVSAEVAEALRSGPAVDWVPARLAHHYGMVPARVEGGVLDLAVAAAGAPGLVPALCELTGLRVEPFVCPPSLISQALDRFYPAEVEPGVIYRSLGDNLLVLSDRKRGIRPHLPELLPEGARAAEWLRAIAVEGVRCRARRIEIEPHPEETRVVFRGTQGDESRLLLPRSVHAGMARLLEGLSRIAARGRVVPREGRLALSVDGRTISAAVTALPTFEGDAYSLDLREDRFESPALESIRADLPGVASAVHRLADEGRGLLLLASPGPAEAQAGLSALLTLLGDRLPRRLAFGPLGRVAGIEGIEGPSGEDLPGETILERVGAARPDLLVLPGFERPGEIAMASAQALERVVIASIRATDVFAVMEHLARCGAGAAVEETLAGILAARLMESLCAFCRRPFDLLGLLSPGPRHRAIGAGPYYSSAGCARCRGSGVRVMEPVFEFLPLGRGAEFPRPGTSAALLREAFAGRGVQTLLGASLRKAAAAVVDVREPLRLLLHEQH